MNKEKFPSILLKFVGAGAILLLLESFVLGGLKGKFSDSFTLALYSLPLLFMLFFMIYACAWAHYRLLALIFENREKNAEMTVVRIGTLCLVVLTEIFILSTFPGANSTYSLILIYIPPLTVGSFVVVLLVAIIRGRRKNQGEGNVISSGDLMVANKAIKHSLIFIFLIILALEFDTYTFTAFVFSVPIAYSFLFILCLAAAYSVKNTYLRQKKFLVGVCVFISIDHVFGAFFLKALSQDPAFRNSTNLLDYWSNFLIAGLAITALSLIWIDKRIKK